MNRLIWIESDGGPLVLLGENHLNVWSGIFNKSLYTKGIVEEAKDFMDAQEADYGKACLVDDYIGMIELEDGIALVFGEEPMPTTILYSSPNEAVFARWYYGETDSETLLLALNFATIKNWEFILNVNFVSNMQYLFDAAFDGRGLKNKKENTDFLQLHLNSGQYNVFSNKYEPNERTRFYLYRLIRIY
jgi:hypothetical protein